MTRKILTPLMLLFFATSLFSQEDEKMGHGISLRAGYAYSLDSPLGEQQNGFHFGLNIHERQDLRLVWEGQVNINYVSDITNIWTINILPGSRFYLNKANNKNRYYVSSLLGITLENGTSEDSGNSEVSLGSSFGIFAQLQKLVIGLSLEDPQILILKLGYTIN